jgi:YfiH family protein
MFFESKIISAIPGITHGFGTLEEEVPSILSSVWEREAPEWQQVHGTTIINVKESRQHCGDADALFCSRPRIPIGVRTADCVPILLANREGSAVAAIHAGWRGTKARIADEVWRFLKKLNEQPANWVAAIGPAIGPCCYEVSEDLAREFANEFGSRHLTGPSRRMLDLQAVNEQQLRELGLRDIEVLRFCTKCHGGGKPIFHSFRREQQKCRQFSLIGIGL